MRRAVSDAGRVSRAGITRDRSPILCWDGNRLTRIGEGPTADPIRRSIPEFVDLLLRNVKRDFAGVDIDSGLEFHLLPNAMPVRDRHGVRTRRVHIAVLDDFGHLSNLARPDRDRPAVRGPAVAGWLL